MSRPTIISQQKTTQNPENFFKWKFDSDAKETTADGCELVKTGEGNWNISGWSDLNDADRNGTLNVLLGGIQNEIVDQTYEQGINFSIVFIYSDPTRGKFGTDYIVSNEAKMTISLDPLKKTTNGVFEASFTGHKLKVAGSFKLT